MSGPEGAVRLERTEPRRTDSIGPLRRAAVEAARGVLPDDVLPDVALAIGELVDNAVRHGVGPAVEMTITTDADRVEVDVTNRRGHIRPPPKSEWVMAEPTAPTGRGLGIVAAVAPEVSLRVTADAASVTVAWRCGDRADRDGSG